MRNKKYILTERTIEHKGHTLYQIQAVKKFANIEKGTLGGFVEGEWNLSQDGNCWIFPSAKVYDKAIVKENACLQGYAQVYNSAIVGESSLVKGCAKVFQHALVDGNAYVGDYAQIYGSSYISGDTMIFDHAKIRGSTGIFGIVRIHGHTEIIGDLLRISGNARIWDGYIQSSKDYLVVGPIGSRNDYTTFYRTKTGSIFVKCGCFSGSLYNFEQAVQKQHEGTEFETEYMSAIALAETKMSRKGA